MFTFINTKEIFRCLNVPTYYDDKDHSTTGIPNLITKVCINRVQKSGFNEPGHYDQSVITDQISPDGISAFSILLIRPN